MYYLGKKYLVESAEKLAQDFLLGQVGAIGTDGEKIFKTAKYFSDKVLEAAVLKRYQPFIVNSVKKALGTSLPGGCSVVFTEFSGVYITKPAREILEAVDHQTTYVNKVAMAITYIKKSLNLASELFKAIAPNSSLELETRAIWKPPTSSFDKLNMLFNDERNCNACSYYSNPHPINQCNAIGVSWITTKYDHSDLLRYDEMDIQFVYEKLKLYLK